MSSDFSNSHSSPALGIALIGAGVVGGGVLDILKQQQHLLQQRCGHTLNITAVVKRDLTLDERLTPYRDLLSNDWRSAVANPQTDIVVELIGGCTTAAECIRAALAAGKPVVTANKALLAETSNTADDILAYAATQSLPIAHEAAIAGCIPVVKTLRESLAGDSVQAMYGVINGTCNYILTAMEAEQSTFAAALEKAQALGYAEAAPAFDIDGVDTAHKLLLMTRIAFGCHVCMADIPLIGIRDLDYCDIVYARQFNYRIKLLAVAKRVANGTANGPVELRVRPAMVPAAHIMASLEGALNAVTIHSQFSGETLYYGAGAGAHPTATAVVADIVDIARRYKDKRYQSNNGGDSIADNSLTLQQHFSTPFYLRVRVLDKPGVIADIAQILAKQNISIEAINQEAIAADTVDLIILLHESEDAKVEASIAAIMQLAAVTQPVVALPIERLN